MFFAYENTPLSFDSYNRVKNAEIIERNNEKKQNYERELVIFKTIYDIKPFNYNWRDYVIFQCEVFADSIIDILKIEKENESRRKQETYWRNLDPYTFESETAEWFREKGYFANVTQKSSDGGVDIVLQKEGQTFYVQCKHYNSKILVQPIRELKGVMSMRGVTKGFIVCLNGLTQQAEIEAKIANIEIVDIKKLCNQQILDDKLPAWKWYGSRKDAMTIHLYDMHSEAFSSYSDGIEYAKEQSERAQGLVHGVFKLDRLYFVLVSSVDNFNSIRPYCSCSFINGIFQQYSRIIPIKRRKRSLPNFEKKHLDWLLYNLNKTCFFDINPEFLDIEKFCNYYGGYPHKTEPNTYCGKINIEGYNIDIRVYYPMEGRKWLSLHLFVHLTEQDWEIIEPELKKKISFFFDYKKLENNCCKISQYFIPMYPRSPKLYSSDIST